MIKFNGNLSDQDTQNNIQNNLNLKYPHTTSKPRLYIKSRRPRNIPEIKIELDEVLCEAYHELNNQPRKNSLLGANDIYVINNDLVQEYVQAVYCEYGIEDPLSSSNSNKQSRSKSNNISTKHALFETPDKFSELKQGRSENKQPRKTSNTAERLSKLKKNFQIELDSPNTNLFQSEPRNFRQQSHTKTQSSSTQKEANKKIPIKLSSSNKQSRIMEYSNASGKSYLFRKNKFNYCLVCEKPLEQDEIGEHQKECEELSKLLNTPNLRIEEISEILDRKIHDLKNELINCQRYLNDDSRTLREIICETVEKNDFDVEGPREDLTMMRVSMLQTIKCIEKIDKLEWFRKMRIKAELKLEKLLE